MYKRYIICLLLGITFLVCSCVKLEHSNPVDPEYKDNDTEETTEESRLPDNSSSDKTDNSRKAENILKNQATNLY